MVLVHEMGHFITAIKSGITAHEFGFGFPPRIVGIVEDEKTGKRKVIWGNKDYHGDKTMYSLNWFPLGGFVRIKGEDGQDKSPDSFATKSIFTRFKVLIAGVTMNFILAWVLINIVLMMGAPEVFNDKIDPNKIVSGPQVQINSIEPKSPADEMGIKIGDVVKETCVENKCITIDSSEKLRDSVLAANGGEVQISVLRGDEKLAFTGIPRTEINENQGALGISMSDVAIVKYSFFEAIGEGLFRVFSLTLMILGAFFGLIKSIFVSQDVAQGVAGPVGIAMLVQQMKDLGFVYILQFAAVLSVNLAIINALPIPALDGGRILFLIFEKIKGRPVNQKVEGVIHTVSFVALMILILVITANDILKLIFK